MRKFALLFAAAALMALFAGCSRKEEPLPEDAHVYEGVKAASAYAALAEKPDARKVLLVGDDAKALKGYFSAAGVKCLEHIEGKADIVAVDCSRMSEKAFSRLESLVSENGVAAWLMNVHGVTAREFRDMVKSFKFPAVHLWMAGEKRWVLVGCRKPRRIKMDALVEMFTRDRGFETLAKSGVDSLGVLLAGYVGTASDIMPAFEGGELSALVRPEFFISKEPPKLDWISAEGVDGDIAKKFFDDIAEAQGARRMVVSGAMKAAGGDEKGAVDEWAAACEIEPKDVFLRERLARLERNAKGFLEVQKVLMAMKCYETMLLIEPDNPAIMHNFGSCLKRIGKLDLAEKVFERAREVMGGKEGGK